MTRDRAAPNSGLTVADVQAIRRALRAGTSRRQVARDWELSLQTIAKIARRDTFAYIPDVEDGQEAAQQAIPVSAATQQLREFNSSALAVQQAELVASARRVAEMAESIGRRIPQAVEPISEEARKRLEGYRGPLDRPSGDGEE
jgi:hypothetical protein